MKIASDVPWLVKAQDYIGVKGAIDLKINPTVIKFFKEAETKGKDDDEADIGVRHVPWCAAFVGAVLKECGIKNTGTLLALDYVPPIYGQKLIQPIVGAIGVKKRPGVGRVGHVFFVVGFDFKYVYGLGGNQDDEVSIERFPRGNILSYCWPEGVKIPT